MIAQVRICGGAAASVGLTQLPVATMILAGVLQDVHRRQLRTVIARARFAQIARKPALIAPVKRCNGAEAFVGLMRLGVATVLLAGVLPCVRRRQLLAADYVLAALPKGTRDHAGANNGVMVYASTTLLSKDRGMFVRFVLLCYIYIVDDDLTTSLIGPHPHWIHPMSWMQSFWYAVCSLYRPLPHTPTMPD